MKIWEPLILLPQVATMTVMKESSGLFMKQIWVENVGMVEKSVRGMYREENIFLKKHVAGSLIKVHGVKSTFH